MKSLFLLLACMGLTQALFCQTKTYDLADLENQVAKSLNVSPDAISSLKVLEYPNNTFVYATLTKDQKSVTYVQEFSFASRGPGIPIHGSITCTGLGCSECDIEGLPDITKVHCVCKRSTLAEGRCDMTKTIGL